MSDQKASDHTGHSLSRLAHQSASQLCARCADIDLRDIWLSRSTKVFLGPVSSWNTNRCMLCSFLRGVLEPLLGPQHSEQHERSREAMSGLEDDFSTPYFIYSMQTRNATLPLLGLQRLWPRMIVLSKLENSHPNDGIPYIAFNPQSHNPPNWLSPVRPLIDFEKPKRWLEMCHKLHGQHCTKSQGNIFVNLKLIDVDTTEVVKAQGGEVFVALSYVWGQGMASASGTATYPRTVRDAITATQKLGYKFLWVDKYCIDQTDEHDFGDQLQQMDAIYRQAVVTLVAAAGEHADYGLPGVDRCRDPAPSAVLPQGYISIVRGLPDMSSSKCRWTTRAWTYQEGLLSTRRLVFTDDQLYFECQGYYCVEMLEISLETWREMHHRQHPYILQRYRSLPHMGVFPLDGCGINPWDIYSRIVEYSQRSLTYEGDILKGILGILRAFERETNPMRHLLGVAFSASAVTSPNAAESNRLPVFSDSLRWGLEQPSARRRGFPSWSWAGWYGTITWPAEYNADSFYHPRRRPQDAKIHGKVLQLSVELRDGALIDWVSFQLRYHELLTTNSCTGIIYVDSWTTPVKYWHDSEMADMHVHLACVDGSFVSMEVQMTTETHFDTQDTLLALNFWQTTKVHVLILKDFGSHWERVAIGAYTPNIRPELERTWRTVRFG